MKAYSTTSLISSCLILLLTTSTVVESFSTTSSPLRPTHHHQAPISKFHHSTCPSISTRTTSTPIVSRKKTTSLHATPVVGAIAGALTGGILGGALHAIAGPDHLAALLPRCCGQRWYKAGRIGALWGMGHGISATLLGTVGFSLKHQLRPHLHFLKGMSHFMEIAVGLSLIVIGVLGLKEAQEWDESYFSQQSLSSAAASPDAIIKESRNRSVIFNGLLHGFSWDGAPSLAPALAVATWGGNLAFLSAYAAGTMGAMAITTTLIGEGTRRAGEVFQRPDLPQRLSWWSSILAIAIGSIWCFLALK
ncbi:hypothetical protein IV203_030660 [Nitzschia inconspicua]|uniref:Uncharacterized protein n=1 Tax=Nitzschia inconspicua TaxID=303405 RepID=A0A9K3Q1F5_9STRA|nr:hypothetical protein IV203_030660 [Nitzschia inconspicua]